MIVTSSFSNADQGFDATGKFSPAANFRKFETTALLEYGFTDWLTAIVKPSVIDMHSSGPTSAHYGGLGMSELGLQARLLQFDSSVVAVQGSFRIPGSADKSNPVLAGSTSIEQDIRLLYGYGFKIGAWDSFVDLQIGYRFRNGGPPDEARIDATFGTRPQAQWLLLFQSFNTISRPSNSIIFPTNSAHKLQASAVYDFTKAWSAQLGLFAAVAGQNALRERGALAALWYRF